MKRRDHHPQGGTRNASYRTSRKQTTAQRTIRKAVPPTPHPREQVPVQEVLRDPVWFGDGPPVWLVGRETRPCESAVDADTQRRKHVKVLRKYGARNPRALALAARIGACRIERPCTSGACPVCMRAFQRWFVNATDAFLTKRAEAVGHNDIAILSIVPTKRPTQRGR